jgi:hypothetical protein
MCFSKTGLNARFRLVNGTGPKVSGALSRETGLANRPSFDTKSVFNSRLGLVYATGPREINVLCSETGLAERSIFVLKLSFIREKALFMKLDQGKSMLCAVKLG